MRFTIYTHVEHIREEDKFFGYPPYIKEMNIWLKHVNEVEVIAPQPPPPVSYRDQRGSFIGRAYNHYYLRFTKIPSLNFLSFSAIIKAVFKIPIIFFRILIAMRKADHIHLRCPGNIGLIACGVQILFPGIPKSAKYAGNWDPNAKRPWSYRLQKWILSNTFLTRNMQVLVYGDWPNQSKNVLPFFTASFSEEEKEKINKEFIAPYKFLFVGNLVPGKQPEVALQIVEDLYKRNIPAELHVYGDGELMSLLQDQAKNKAYIHLHGNQPIEVLKKAYKDGHFLILVSKSEGWPKVVAEAMWFGCIPVATGVSCVPWMLGRGSRGILISDNNCRDGNPVDSGQRTVDSPDELGKENGGHPPLQFGQGGKRSLPEPLGAGVDSQDGEKGMKRRGRNLPTGAGKEKLNLIDDTVERIIKLINNPEEMRRMSKEAQKWSQEYTLERFEEAIKEVLGSKDVRP